LPESNIRNTIWYTLLSSLNSKEEREQPSFSCHSLGISLKISSGSEISMAASGSCACVHSLDFQPEGASSLCARRPGLRTCIKLELGKRARIRIKSKGQTEAAAIMGYQVAAPVLVGVAAGLAAPSDVGAAPPAEVAPLMTGYSAADVLESAAKQAVLIKDQT
jgi:hypothetical protein